LKIPDSSLVDAYFALSFCDCLPQLQAALTTSLNEQRGALPQALTPAIRREILSNPKLKLLDIIPRPVDDIVGGIFADEMSVAKEVSEGLGKKIARADGTWNPPGSNFAYQLDSFIPLPGTQDISAGRFVQMRDVWSRWGLVLSQGGPWSQLRQTHPLRGLMWHETLRILAEAEYLYGLNDDGKGGQWGGLTLPIDLQINTPGAFDPRKPSNQVRFLTGTHDLTLPGNNSLSLARFGGERWTWRMDKVTLAEQALNWWTSARMLRRLRPAGRGEFARYFAADAIFPDDAYQLSLIALPALDALLSERFIDENTRAIQEELSGPQVAGVSQTLLKNASPQTLGLLLFALSEWASQLRDISDLSVSQDTKAQLANAPKSLTRAAQLVVQTMLAENIATMKTDKSIFQSTKSFSIYSGKKEKLALPIKDHAMILSALISAETQLMPSSFLRGRIQQLTAGLIERILVEQTDTKKTLSLSQMIWMHTSLNLYKQSYNDTTVGPQIDKLQPTLQNQLMTFEKDVFK
jgi:hypothetical protein